jgi:CRP/FNR family transcriptional regulator, cyclic AMP receptor protein
VSAVKPLLKVAKTDGHIQRFNKGQVLIRENEISRKMFVVRHGKVRVYKTYMGQKITIAVLGEGEIFGELSFFDGQPRSATVEAVTNVEAFVIDSDEAQEAFKGLPEWFQPIVKTVFNRLRSADTKTTLLQSMNEIEKRHFKRDTVAKGLYAELYRFNQVFGLLYERLLTANKKVTSKELLGELERTLGDTSLNLQSYWRLLHEYDFIDRDVETKSGEVQIRKSHFDLWLKELKMQIDTERYVILSPTAVAILKRLMGVLGSDHDANKTRVKVKKYKVGDLGIDAMPMHDEALAELVKHKLVTKGKGGEIAVEPPLIFKAYTYQSILKHFDPTAHHI